MKIMNNNQASRIMYNDTVAGTIRDIFHDYMIDSDGTIWLHFFHQNNKNNTNLFSSSTKSANVNGYTFVNYDCWNAGPLLYSCDHGTGYEILAVQDGVRNRWIQADNPHTATYNSTLRANITVLEGLVSPSEGSSGGIYKSTSLNNFWIHNVGISGNWWGTGYCGGWSYGCPGFNTVSTNGTQDLYVRVYSLPESRGG